MSRKFIESEEEMEKLLTEERVGYLGLSQHNVPYVVPLTYGYFEGKIIFHGSLEGKKLEIIRVNPAVCFTVSRHYGAMVSHPQGAECHADSDSVICYGRARIIEDIQERCMILNKFNRRLQPQAREITEVEVESCSAVEISIEQMTGRTERDSKCTFWKWNIDNNHKK
jgi:nitroimidazol reductase NimA-like FMN-containing flavoprotein (pyridoxamine 5'-phosphate oxidase superfamily)